MQRGLGSLAFVIGSLSTMSSPAFAGGVCSTPADCNDGVFCTVDLCVFNQCTHGHNDSQCSDGLDCTGEETCNAATDQCQAGTPIQCPPGQFCSTVLDRCVECDDHIDCSDFLFCTGSELCIDGSCIDGTPPECPDSGCLVGVCEPGIDQCILAGTTCTDGNGCTVADFCNQSGVCAGIDVNTLPCDAHSDCPRGFCRTADGFCDCTQCDVPADCNDGFPCTTDTCNTSFGYCVQTPNDATCASGLFCQQRICDPEFGCAAKELCTPTDGNPCAAPAGCNEGNDTCGGCRPPTVTTTSRYLRITANAANAGSVALAVRGDCLLDPVDCVNRYVDFDNPVNPSDPKAGRLVPAAVAKTAAAWGTVMVRDGDMIRPSATYLVYSECGTVRSAAVRVTTWTYGDTNNNGVANFTDISRAVDAFRGFFTPALTREETDVAVTGPGCHPDRLVNFSDINTMVNAFRNLPFPCTAPCP